jgi:chromate transporter
MGAGALILAQTTDRSLVAVFVTGAVAVLASATKINPFWMFLAGGILGFAGVI